MKIDKRTAVVAVAAFALAWFVAHGSGSPVPNPFVPARPQRPVLQFIAKLAKSLLWVAVFAEKRPADPQYTCRVVDTPESGAVLNHAEGW